MKFLIFILICFLLFVALKVYSKYKIPKVGTFNLISGAPKTGKSTLSVAIILKEIKYRRFWTKFYNFFRSKDKKVPLPLLYSNVPLDVPYGYVPLTNDLLLRNERFVYGSVIYVQEASLVADSQLIKDNEINTRLLEFNKLIGHELKGGCIVYDTQCIGDLHYSIKRCLSNYFYIHRCRKMFFLPFIVCYVRELFYSDDNTSINTFNEDLEESLKKVIIPKKTWHFFDCYTYSVMTDYLPVNDKVVCPSTLKTTNILTFKVKKDDKKGVSLNVEKKN